MGLRINSNVASISALRNLGAINERMAKHFVRLATGQRIASAADDPSGLAIAARLQAQIRGHEAALRNALDGISALQIADGALGEAESQLIRMRELAVQAANGTLTAVQRASLDEEFQTLIESLDSVARATEFNGIDLLTGSQATITLQVGPNAGDTYDVTLAATTSGDLGLDALDIGTPGGATGAIGVLDRAMEAVSLARGRFGASINVLEARYSFGQVAIGNLSAARSRIIDVDVAEETAALARDQVLQQAAIAVLAQANQLPTLALRLLG